MNEFTIKKITEIGFLPNITKEYYFKSKKYNALFLYQDRTYELYGTYSEFAGELGILKSMGFQKRGK